MQQSLPHWEQQVRDHVSESTRPLVVVIGPTASGKSAFSVDVATFLQQQCGNDAEIMNADSRQLYRGLNIGTAKSTEEERGNVPHHLLDVLDPKERISAAQYKTMAESCIDAVQARGNVPILVGGSMLYVAAVIDGLTFAEPAEEKIRGALLTELEEKGRGALHARLAALDPPSAVKIPAENVVHILRALEICESTGRPASEVKQEQRNVCRYDLLIFGIDLPREELYRRIEKRTEEMLSGGWMEEVQSLLRAGVSTDAPAMQSCGYREIAAFLSDHQSGDNDAVAGLRTLITAKTRQYAKRQITWWRNDERIQWVKPMQREVSRSAA